MATLAFDVRGDDRGPPLICLPAFATTGETAAAAFEPALEDTGLRRIYVDLPGHGGSPATAEASSEAVLAEVTAFIRHHADTPALVVGCSRDQRRC